MYCVPFQVTAFENDVFIALETSKIDTFLTIFLCIIKQLGFSFSIVDLCAQRGFEVIFRAQDDKTVPKHAS